MKKTNFYFILFLIVLISCSKDVPQTKELIDQNPIDLSKASSAESNLLPGMGPGSGGNQPGTLPAADIYYSPSNGYYSLFAGGITFGSSFPHPSSITQAQSGTPYTPSGVAGGLNGNNVISVYHNGPYITIKVGTGSLVANGHQLLTTYYNRFDNYVNNVMDPITHQLKEPTLPSPPRVTSDFEITYVGTFLLNYNNKITFVSIADGIQKSTAGMPFLEE